MNLLFLTAYWPARTSQGALPLGPRYLGAGCYWLNHLLTHFQIRKPYPSITNTLSIRIGGKQFEHVNADVFRYAVVTGANKGMGLEICKQLASNGVKVVLTARDENRGIAALEKFKGTDICDLVIFHKLDVADSASVAALAQFVKNQFGKLDILVNNAAIGGVEFDAEALKTSGNEATENQVKIEDTITDNAELVGPCLQTNYYGVKRMVEHFLPLLKLSDSPRIVNVSSSVGKLKGMKNEWAKGILSDVDNLTEEKIDEVHDVFVKDFKEGVLEAKGWPTSLSTYILSKASLNAYTRILAKKYPSICINCVDPGFVKTDLVNNLGIFTAEEGAEISVKAALLPNGSPSGCFFDRNGVTTFE